MKFELVLKGAFAGGGEGGMACNGLVQRKMLRLEIFLSNNVWWGIYAIYSEQPEYLQNFYQQKDSTHHQ